jgi:hypothetical protein
VNRRRNISNTLNPSNRSSTVGAGFTRPTNPKRWKPGQSEGGRGKPRPYILLLAGFSLLACSQKNIVKPDTDTTKIHRIAVMEFEGAGGPAVTHEFIRQLVGTGLEVSSVKAGSDAVLRGSVNPYKPAEKLIVYLGNTLQALPNGQTVAVINPVVSSPGVPIVSTGSAMGVTTVQMVESSARLGVLAQLVDSRSARVIWTGAWEYESLDVPGVTQSIVTELLKSLARTVPAARPKS